jgi:hypothetical protein
MPHQPIVGGLPPGELSAFCHERGYHCRLELAGSLLMPPETNVGLTDWERALRLRWVPWAACALTRPCHQGPRGGHLTSAHLGGGSCMATRTLCWGYGLSMEGRAASRPDAEGEQLRAWPPPPGMVAGRAPKPTLPMSALPVRLSPGKALASACLRRSRGGGRSCRIRSSLSRCSSVGSSGRRRRCLWPRSCSSWGC